MGRPELHETLTALVGAIPLDGPLDGPVVLDLDLEVPMEVTLGLVDGDLVFHAAPAASRFTSSFLPPVHSTWLHVVALPTGNETGPYGPSSGGIQGWSS